MAKNKIDGSHKCRDVIWFLGALLSNFYDYALSSFADVAEIV